MPRARYLPLFLPRVLGEGSKLLPSLPLDARAPTINTETEVV